MKIGERISQLRKNHGYAMQTLADKSNLTKGYISMLEKGINPGTGKEIIPSLETVQNISNAFNMSLDMFLDGVQDSVKLPQLNKTELPSILQKINKVSENLSEPRQEKVYHFAEHQLEQQRLEEHYADYVVGQTAAGEPLVGQQPVPFVGLETIRLMVNGDSMEPEFFDGDIIEYKPQSVLENGELGVFAVNGGITMKKFKTNGDVHLQSVENKGDKFEELKQYKELLDLGIISKKEFEEKKKQVLK
ncbi:helix-turn-helix domain-containing protein [Allofustis seminis]|uniref:helix-turn-helix domain-containing protein n=1 Tax=Allofustis seminis TaxID=166939 RepID=UPI000360D7AE|nr:S24 family peptidase [Allofustis seminis]